MKTLFVKVFAIVIMPFVLTAGQALAQEAAGDWGGLLAGQLHTGSPAEYSQIEETISPVALKVITDWVTASR